MFRNIVLPMQAWLLVQKQCTSCGRSLEKSKKRRPKNGIVKVFCRCGQAFIYDKQTKKYQRVSKHFTKKRRVYSKIDE